MDEKVECFKKVACLLKDIDILEDFVKVLEPEIKKYMIDNNLTTYECDGYIFTKETIELEQPAYEPLVNALGPRKSEFIKETRNDKGEIESFSIINEDEMIRQFPNIKVEAYTHKLEDIIGYESIIGGMGHV